MWLQIYYYEHLRLPEGGTTMTLLIWVLYAGLVIGSVLAMNGTIEFGVIISFILYVRLFTSPLTQIAARRQYQCLYHPRRALCLAR